MTIAPGTRLGSYEIVAQIGAGCMGEVYRAHDTKLTRRVASRVLPGNFVNDPDRLSRFQRKARILAPAQIIVVQNWIEELKQKAPLEKK